MLIGKLQEGFNFSWWPWWFWFDLCGTKLGNAHVWNNSTFV